MTNIMGRVILKPRQERRLQAGHLWVFSNEIARVEGVSENGDIVEVLTGRGGFVGVGYYNRHSLIAVRMLSRHLQAIDASFFRKRLQRALEYRTGLYAEGTAYRLAYSEGDQLPGLIVDRYGDYLVVQILTLGMEKLSAVFLPLLSDLLSPRGILLRNDSAFRDLEGLPRVVQVHQGEIPPEVQIQEEGLSYGVDLQAGQKTGFFFDQRDNRLLARRYAANRRVLDCFCYTGGFALNAARGGAAKIMALDQSAEALTLARRNAELNGLTEKVFFEQADCLERLRQLQESPPRFDLIILDPPAFAKTRAQAAKALGRYQALNAAAVSRIAPEGGFLVTSSCSHFVDESMFLETVKRAIVSAGRTARLLELRGAAPDHPVLLAMPETAYLKCLVLRID